MEELAEVNGMDLGGRRNSAMFAYQNAAYMLHGPDTALDMALKDKNFLQDTIRNFVCPAEFSKHYTNHCEGKYPDTSMCKKCWNQQAHPIERAGFGGARRE